MTIAFLHTAALHEASFAALLADQGYHGGQTHLIRADLLDRARNEGPDAVAAEVDHLLRQLAGEARAVVCTCSTLGPLVDRVTGDLPHVLRIDRPLMQAALRHGPDILVAYCLDSTRTPTLELLQDCAATAGVKITPHPLRCNTAWSRFESGDMPGYADAITDAIHAEIATQGRPGCILLAQASMMVATPNLDNLDLPILTAPPLVTARAIALAGCPASSSS